MQRKIRKRIAILTIALLLMAIALPFVNRQPGQINLIVGKESNVKLQALFPKVSLIQQDPAVAVNGQALTDISVNNGDIVLKSDEEGTFSISAEFFGLKIQEWTVNVLPDTVLYPGGELIGVELASQGLIAVGYQEINSDTPSPAKKANIKVGDIVQKINDIEISNAEEFSALLNQVTGDGKLVKLTVMRAGRSMDVLVKPEYSDSKGQYIIGLYIKDNIAGIGTLTYLSEDKTSFGALGHAITENNTGTLVPIHAGTLRGAQVLSLVKGEKNEPGAIHGMFPKNETSFGQITGNNDFGIFGVYRGGLFKTDKAPMPIALQSEVQLGPATIMTTLDDKVKEYDIEITKVNRQTAPSTKSMVIQVTDPELLAKTGGIIQGMSGSPIIQNGKIVGAVTHVLVNDPTTGYGVFIEWMLQNNGL